MAPWTDTVRSGFYRLITARLQRAATAHWAALAKVIVDNVHHGQRSAAVALVRELLLELVNAGAISHNNYYKGISRLNSKIVVSIAAHARPAHSAAQVRSSSRSVVAIATTSPRAAPPGTRAHAEDELVRSLSAALAALGDSSVPSRMAVEADTARRAIEAMLTQLVAGVGAVGLRLDTTFAAPVTVALDAVPVTAPAAVALAQDAAAVPHETVAAAVLDAAAPLTLEAASLGAVAPTMDEVRATAAPSVEAVSLEVVVTVAPTPAANRLNAAAVAPVAAQPASPGACALSAAHNIETPTAVREVHPRRSIASPPALGLLQRAVVPRKRVRGTAAWLVLRSPARAAAPQPPPRAIA